MSPRTGTLILRAGAIGVAVVTLWLVYRFRISPGWDGFDQVQRTVAVAVVVVLLALTGVGTFYARRAWLAMNDEEDP